MEKPKTNILIVDDHPLNLKLLEATLAELNQNILKAQSGEECIAVLNHQPLAAVVLDVQMPGMDGFQTASAIRANPSTSELPILFLTSGDPTREQLIEGYKLGIGDYLVKPIIPELLLAKLTFFIALFKKNQLISEQSELLKKYLLKSNR